MKSLKLLLRFLTVGGLVLLLLVPLLMIRGTVNDRKQYQALATERVARSTAGAQQVVGPLRVIPYRETRISQETGSSGNTVHKTHVIDSYVYQTPKNLQLTGGMKPDARRVGLYEVRVYEWNASMQAAFDAWTPAAVEGRVYGQPYLVLGLADVRGLVGTPDFRLGSTALVLEAGTAGLSGRMAGLHARLPQAPGEPLPADELKAGFRLAGTQSLGIAPVADSNQVSLGSSWPHPLFGGSFLPNTRSVRAEGFSADWEVSSLASDAQLQLSSQLGADSGSVTQRSTRDSLDPDSIASLVEGGSTVSGIDSIEVSLVDPTDVYTQADRASKYGILFVVLTFVGFALFELIKRLPIHPLQYLLVGLALAIFFLLLLSLSEHIPFWQAYVAAAAACIGLQFAYLTSVLKSRKRACAFALMLTALYGVLYGLLVSENNALLMGSLLLFGILSLIMWITRKVDWYELAASLR